RPGARRILEARNGAGDIEHGALDRLGVGVSRQRRQLSVERLQRFALYFVRRAEDLRRLDEIVVVADRIADELIKLRMRLRGNAFHMAENETPEHALVMGIRRAGKVEEHREGD